MKKTKVGLRYKGRKIFVYAEKSSGIIGLMFSRKEKARALLFEFGNNAKVSLHSLFVFFPFIAIWLDGKGRIAGMRIVKPFSFGIAPKKPFSKVVEIPINMKYMQIAKKLVGKGKI
jgi:uncharacterized membrane protein (UPF0127 family)